MAKIFLALPSSGQTIPSTASAVLRGTRQHSLAARSAEGSPAAHCFNVLWCEACNEREQEKYTHFAMLHADISTDVGFLDTMIEEMEKIDADILSAVVMVGDERCLTSTGIQQPWTRNVRRLTETEVYRLPVTFSIADTDTPDRWLALNTGLWICRFTEPWVEEFPGFRMLTRIVSEGGKRYPWQCSEDWDFSDWANKRGLKLFATRAVQTWHRKTKEYYLGRYDREWMTDEHYSDIEERGEHANCIMASRRNDNSG